MLLLIRVVLILVNVQQGKRAGRFVRGTVLVYVVRQLRMNAIADVAIQLQTRTRVANPVMDHQGI